MLIYDWLRESKSIGQYFLRCCFFILYIILIICSTTVINKIILDCNKNYILISMSKFNSMVIVGLFISIILAIYCYIDIVRYTKEFKFGRNIENYCRLGFIITLTVIISSLVYFCNNYYVFYNDRIEKHNIFGNNIYSYKDIQSIDTGYKKIKSGEYLYYRINLKNGKSVDIANGLVLEPNEEKIVLKVDKITKANRVSITRDVRNTVLEHGGIVSRADLDLVIKDAGTSIGDCIAKGLDRTDGRKDGYVFA